MNLESLRLLRNILLASVVIGIWLSTGQSGESLLAKHNQGILN